MVLNVLWSPQIMAAILPANVLWNTDFDSSNVQAVAYDQLTETLYVAFHSGAHYRYLKVSAEDADSLVQAESVGSFLNSRIKPSHAFEKV
jgi:hypothetical protein